MNGLVSETSTANLALCVTLDGMLLWWLLRNVQKSKHISGIRPGQVVYSPRSAKWAKWALALFVWTQLLTLTLPDCLAVLYCVWAPIYNLTPTVLLFYDSMFSEGTAKGTNKAVREIRERSEGAPKCWAGKNLLTVVCMSSSWNDSVHNIDVSDYLKCRSWARFLNSWPRRNVSSL